MQLAVRLPAGALRRALLMLVVLIGCWTLLGAATARAAQPGVQPQHNPIVRPAPAGSRLTITARANRRSARAGQTIRYSVTIRNRGTAPAAGARLCATVPRGTRLTARGGAAAPKRGKPLCWKPRTLAPGATRTMSFAVKVERVDRRPFLSTVTLAAPGVKARRGAVKVTAAPSRRGKPAG